MQDIAAALAAENRRLVAEVDRLEARLEAVERSRWHRLNPRGVLHRLRRSPTPPQAAARQSPSASAAFADDALAQSSAAFTDEVVARGRFTHRWALGHAGWWEPILAGLAEREETRVLEVGSFEGLSACYVLWRLPKARITCVDTFGGSIEHAGSETVPDELERIFDANVALVDRSRVRKLVGESRRELPALLADVESFDLVYLDGSHLGLDVLVDAALSWQLLAAGGTLVFDDYLWAELGDDPLLRPRPAIDAFLALVEGKYDLLFAHEQVAVRKRGQTVGLGQRRVG